MSLALKMLAFAIGKSDRNFFEKIGQHKFRYRSDLIEDGLRGVIAKNDLKEEVFWDRGMGVFVYNLYYKENLHEDVHSGSRSSHRPGCIVVL